MMGQASTNLSGSSLRLRQAILANDILLVERLLQAHPQLLHNPDFKDKSNTSLHLAAQAGHAELAELLISKGHDRIQEVTDYIYSNAGNNLGVSVNTDGHSPLHIAASRHHAEVVEVLCTQFPSTINRPDKEGRTPLLLAAGAQMPITTKAVAGRKNTLQGTEDVRAIEILLRRGADVKARDRHGDTCLHQACAWGNLKSTRVLVQAGADPLQANYAGWKPDAYSLSVQADVYFRNLVAEFERRKAEDAMRIRDTRRGNGGGRLRLVDDHEEEDEPEPRDVDDSGRTRAGSGRSDTSNEAISGNGLGINVGNRSETWR